MSEPVEPTADDLQVQASRIREKLRIVQERAAAGTLPEAFGSESHGFRLSSPLSEEEVLGWEARYGIALPEAYRAFLRYVGVAGAGPFYGLESPENWGEAPGISGEDLAKVMQEPCLYDEGWEGRDEDWLDERAGPDWEARFNKDEFFPTQGTLTLCHQGCAIYSVLVLNGPHRGAIVNAYWLDPPSFSSAPHFLAWYEGWLDRLLANIGVTWYGYAPNNTSSSGT